MFIARLAGLWLFFLAAFGWGASAVYFKIFPHQLLNQVADFMRGGAGEDTDTVGRLLNDAGLVPERFLWDFEYAAIGSDFSTLDVQELRERRDMPLIHLSPEAPRGYRVLFGAFDFEETLWGALLIGPDGELLRQWALSTDHLPTSTAPSERKNMYGVNMLADGSIIFLMQEVGGGIVSVDACGVQNWAREGLYHHTVSLDGRGGFWTYEGNQEDFDPVLERIDTKTGELLDSIDMREVRISNPNVHVFDLQRKSDVPDRTHSNDIEELRPDLADLFPGFETGDLLLSYRVPNLVFVLDPETSKIKWWRVGPWDSQHDPDWGTDGRISVFSNNQRGVGDHSKIVAIDPATYETENLVEGIDHNFYSRHNGMHQITGSGNILITSSTQGRIFEVDNNGNVVFDFINLYDAEENRTLHVGNALFLPLDYFGDQLPDCQ